ncbi:MAG: hypothetical protein CMF96_12400 [Candidatus Marinimicrobia bacterium]|nr:hypothetical protein [Candidatus Neomarinimicrobiota bacterium]|tara:strand:+ start:2578 stop:4101 length:1524 start_codon:yes stop_codon:yes gene_type:complete
MNISKFFHFLNPLIIGIFFIAFLQNNNIGEGIEISEVLSLFIIVSIFSYLVFLISTIIFKNPRKASFYSLILLFIFFSYGYFYQLFNEIFLIKEIARHRYLVPIILIVLTIGMYKVRKNNNEYKNFHGIFFIIFTTLILVNYFMVLRYDLGPSRPVYSDIDIKIENSKNKDFPDVYHIILDMYPTEDILNSRFGFNNENFINELTSLGFRKENLKANYQYTHISIPSTTNMKHFYDSDEDEKNFMNETYHSFNKSSEAFIANKLGYKVYEATTEDANFLSSFFSDFSKIFIRTSMVSVLDDSPLPIHNLWIIDKQKRFQDNFKLLSRTLDKDEKSWFYFYSKPPHSPFIFDENGPKKLNSSPNSIFSFKGIWDEKSKKNYIDQLKYVNKTTLEAIKNILTNNQNTIIILHSDHGIHGLDHGINNFSDDSLIDENGEISNDVFQERFSTMNFTYTPDNCIGDEEKIESNINIISTLFRECFGLNTPDNKNIKFWTPYETEEFILINEN